MEDQYEINYKEMTQGYLSALYNFYVAAYYLDLKNEKYYDLAQNLTAADWSKMDEYIKEFVRPEDQALMVEITRIDYIRDRLMKEENYSYEIRDFKTGKERWIRYAVMRGQDEDHAAISLLDVTDQVNQRLELESLKKSLENQNNILEVNQAQLEESTAEQEAQIEEITDLNTSIQRSLEIISSLGKDYFGLYYIDLASQRFQQIHIEKNELRSDIKDSGDAHQRFIKMSQCFVDDRDQASFMEFCDVTTLSERLKDQDSISIEYRNKEGNWCEGSFLVVHRNQDQICTDVVWAIRSIQKIKDEEAMYRKELEEAYHSVQESSKALNRVHELLGSGQWKIEYDNTGKEISIEFSDELRHLFGYNDKTDFPDSLEFLMSLVHPLDYDSVVKGAYEVVNSKDIKDVNISIHYRAYRKNGECHWYHNQGLVKRNEEGLATLAYGVIMDETDLMDAQQSQQEALNAFEAVHDSLGSANWQMNFDREGKMISCIWSDRFRHMVGYDGLEDFPDEFSSWTDILHPEDKQKTLEAYWSVVNDRERDIDYTVKYRLLTKSDGYRWYSAHGALSRYDNGMPKVYYGILLDIHEQMIASQKQKEQMEEIITLNTELEESAAENEAQIEEITALNSQLQENQARLEEATAEQEAQIEEITALNKAIQDEQALKEKEHKIFDALSESYLNVYLIDSNTEKIEILKLNGYVTDGLDKNKQDLYPYEATCQMYINNRVYEEDKQTVTENMSLDHLLRELSDKKEYEYNYRVPENGQISYYQGKYVDVGDGFIVCGFQNIDETVKAEKERNELLEQAKSEVEAEKERVSEAYGMIEGLSQDYHTIWVVDKITSKMRLIRSSGVSTIQNAVQMGKDLPEFDKGFYSYINTYVEPEDRERMFKEIAFCEILHQLEINPQKLYAVNYLRRDDSGHVGYHQIAFANADTKDGKKQFVYGFRDVDQLVKEEQAEKQKLKDAYDSLAESTAEREAQIEEITALNVELQENQARLEEATSEQEAQIEEITELNRILSEYSTTMANAGYGMWHIILKDGTAPRMQVNDKMAELLGIAGQKLTEEQLYNAWYDQIVPSAIPSVQASVGEMLSGHFSENTYQWKHPVNGVIYVRCGGTCETLEDGTNILSGYHSDVTQIVYEDQKRKEELEKARNKAEEEQERVSEAYGMIEGLSQDYHTIWIVDKVTSKMRLIRSSGVSTIQNAVQMGKDLPEFDKGFYSYINTYVEPEDRERMFKEIAFCEILHQLEINPQKLYAVNYLRRDDSGHVGYHQIAFANADTKDGKKQFVYGFRDVDQLVKEEQAQKEEMRKAKEGAEAANQAKTSFLFNMSHDIRTPMNAIMGFRDLLEKHQEDPVKRQDYLNKIEDSSRILLSIINNVLEMARIEKGAMIVEDSAWSAEQFNDTLYSIFSEMMKNKGLKFTREIHIEHNYVYCDSTKLREIFINILSNAYKYTPSGSVHMKLEELPYDKEGWALYRTTISDTGIGMSEEFVPRIFEEFAREYNTTEVKIEGTGLGMPIVKRLVDLMNGTIEVHSKKGEGSTFIVTIPHQIAEKTDLIDLAGVELDPKLFNGKHILLAEDNALNAEIATEILQETGFVIDWAQDGKIACDTLEKSEPDYYDLILMDIQMPNMNGFEATKTIRHMTDPVKANIPILAMTANAFEEDKKAALNAGMNGHVAKPIDIKELMRALAHILG